MSTALRESLNRTGPFTSAVLLIAGAYLGIAAIYVLRLPLVMDEFQGAFAVDRLSGELPYRDFRPYKTVLGYYLQAPFLALGETTWSRLIATKLSMAALNALLLTGAAFRLRRHFAPSSVLAGLAMTAVMSTFLERGADFRVDMLTAWAGFYSLLDLLDKRYARAGLLVALSFCISQKGLYYVLAAQAALWCAWLVWKKGDVDLRSILRFSFASAGGLALYLAVWSILSSPRAVLEATFLSHGAIALGDLYDIQLRYWGQTIARNPLFYGLALTAFALLDRQRRSQDGRWILVPYGVTLVALCAWHKQPWPYFFVLLIPTVFLLVTAAIAWIRASPYFERGSTRLVGAVIFTAFGIIWPLLRVPTNLARDSSVQERTIGVAEAALSEHDTYIAGVDMLFDRQQTTRQLQWLDRPAAEALRRTPTAELHELISEIEADPPRIFIESYRTQQLPQVLRTYLRDHYCHLAANVFQRCALLPPGQSDFPIEFSGQWTIETRGSATLDGEVVRTGDRVTLERGSHSFEGAATRLTLNVPGLPTLNDRERAPDTLFPNVYDY